MNKFTRRSNDVDLPAIFTNMLNEISDMVFLLDVFEEGMYRHVFSNKSVLNNKNIGDVYGQKIEDVLSAERMSTLYSKLNDTVSKKETIVFQETYNINGGIKVSEIILIPLFLHEENCVFIQMIVKDVTEVGKRDQNVEEVADPLKITRSLEVKLVQNEFELIWDNTNDAIFTIGHDGAVLQANPAFSEILGWKLSEVKGYPRPPFFIEEFSHEDHMKQLDQFRKGESISYFETKRKRKDGTDIDILATFFKKRSL